MKLFLYKVVLRTPPAFKIKPRLQQCIFPLGLLQVGSPLPTQWPQSWFPIATSVTLATNMFAEDSTSKCEMEQPMDLSTTSRSAADTDEQATDLTLVSAREQCEPLNLSITTSRELPSQTNLSSNFPYQSTSQSTNQSTSQTKLYGCMSESKTQLVSSATCSVAFNEDCRPRVTASSVRRCQSYSPTSFSSPSQYGKSSTYHCKLVYSL